MNDYQAGVKNKYNIGDYVYFRAQDGIAAAFAGSIAQIFEILGNFHENPIELTYVVGGFRWRLKESEIICKYEGYDHLRENYPELVI